MSGNVRAKRARRRLKRDAGKARTDWVSTRLSAEEKARVTATAKALGVARSAFVATVVMKAVDGYQELALRPVWPEVVIGELNRVGTQVRRIGVNLNQLARGYNSTGRLPETAILTATCDEVMRVAVDAEAAIRIAAEKMRAFESR